MYPIGRNHLVRPPKAVFSKRAAPGRSTIWFFWVLATVVIVLAGVGYRILASHLKLVVETPIALPVPLSAFPAHVGAWTGKDVPIPQNVQRAAGNDDFINRLYVNNATQEWVNVYVAYSARPRTMVGHRPEVCYVGGGWVHDSTQPSQVISSTGRTIPCVVHWFHMPAPHYEEIAVLSFYIVNGRITSAESVFSGLGWRTPNIAGNPARYVAQVQISSVLENSVRDATKDLTELLIDFFPDENGFVRAATYIRDQGSALK